jgi:hypothetical protein
VTAVLISVLVALLQTAPVQGSTPAAPEKKVWVGCLQAGSAPSTFRLNLDEATDAAGPDDPASLGPPFVQLIGDATRLNLTRHVGKHVRIKGRELSHEEAAQEAALRPDLQEAATTAGGIGGRAERHLRYVRVESISAARGECR